MPTIPLPSEDPDERTSLLPEQSTPPSSRNNCQTRSLSRLLLVLCFSVVAADFGNCLSYAPSIAIYESIICRRVLDNEHSMAGEDNWRCKSSDVQGELALLNAWKDTFDQLPGILLAVFYGYMADRIGRKPVLLLSLTGLALEEVSIRLVCWWNEFIPLRMIWATPIFQVIGGGPQVATSMAYVIITDVFSAERRAPAFFLMGAAILLGEILATPISAWLMSWDPWVPSLAGVSVQLIGFLAAMALPETKQKPSGTISTQPEHHHEPFATTDARDMADSGSQERKDAWIRGFGMATRRHLPTLSMFGVVGAFLLASIGRQALQLIIQYASRRFGWSIAQASFLITAKGIVTLVTLLILLPRISVMLSRRMPPVEKDLRIVQGSVSILTLGTMIMALAMSPVPFVIGVIVFAVGWGFYSALRSLATSLAKPDTIGALNTTIGLAQSIGTMVAGPILASAFRYGMKIDGLWQGFPYMVAAVLFFGASCLTFCIRVSQSVERV